MAEGKKFHDEAVFFDLYETLVTEFDPDWRPKPIAAERLGIDQGAFDLVAVAVGSPISTAE